MTPEKFWTNTSKKYAKSPIKDMDTYKLTMERTKSYLTKDSNVLEIGCGTGSTALLLAENLGQITGTDFSDGMIEIANDKLKNNSTKNVTFKQTTILDNNLKKESYDAVLGFSILHLLEDLPESIKEINELLKSGGVLISKTVCMGSGFSIWKPLLFIMQLLGRAPYVNLISIKDLEKTITDNGFEIVESDMHPASSKIVRFIVAKKL